MIRLFLKINNLSNLISLYLVIYLFMARTKQTARKTWLGGKGLVKKKGVASKAALRKTKPTSGSMVDEKQEEVPDVVNTQQFSLNFDDQEQCEKGAVKAAMHQCSQCEAFFTVQGQLISHQIYQKKKNNPKLTDIEKQKFLEEFQNVWICQFCLKHNSIPKNYFPPKADNPCLILADAKKDKKGNVINEEKMLIFCIDISSSMNYNFQGKTRLSSVKEAILDEINRLKFEKEKIKVGIITFGNYVNLIGDGKAFEASVLKTQLYKNFDGICQQLKDVKDFCLPIDKSYNSLKKTVQDLTTLGSTALGPALLAAVQLASKGPVGSKIILCTDGQANVGLGGSLDNDRFTFYSKLAQHTKRRRVMVNILSLKGDRCNLKQLGKLSLATGGSILKIDPQALGTQFNKIIKENILGTESKLVVKVNKVFKICNGMPDEISKDQTTLIQDFGNFSAQTILSFEFQTISKEEAAKDENIDLGLYSQKRVPMQIQLQYIGRKGQKYLQIVTDWREITQNFEDIYEGADFGLFAISILQRASQKIKSQQYQDASSILRGYRSLVEQKFQKSENKENLQRFNQRVSNLQRVLKSKMAKNQIKMPEFQVSKRSRGSKGGRGGRGGAGRVRKQRSRSKSLEKEEERMASDSEEEILWGQIRARDTDRTKIVQKKVQKPIKRQDTSRQRSRNKKK